MTPEAKIAYLTKLAIEKPNARLRNVMFEVNRHDILDALRGIEDRPITPIAPMGLIERIARCRFRKD